MLKKHKFWEGFDFPNCLIPHQPHFDKFLQGRDDLKGNLSEISSLS